MRDCSQEMLAERDEVRSMSPVYVYECGRCQQRFEVKQGFDDLPLTRCPNCEGKVKRVIFPTPFVFVGPNFKPEKQPDGSNIWRK